MSHYVARTAELIRESGMPHQFGPMSACVEGEWDELMALASRCFKEVQGDSHHVLVNMRVAWRPGQLGRLAAAGNRDT